MKFIVDKTIPYIKGHLETIGEVVYLASEDFTPEQIKDADALVIRSIIKCTPELLKGSKVKLITTATIGFDHIDIDYCDRNGIKWTNSPGSNAESVGQYIVNVLIAYCGTRGLDFLKGKTLGIVGVGHVGSVVLRYAKHLGMRVLLNDPPRVEQEGEAGFVSLKEIAEEADIITFHTPLTKKGAHATYHLADRTFFESLKKKPLIINASRGSVVDNNALIEALEKKQIEQAIIDCWENEPNISCELLEKVQIGTPHIAGFSADGKANGSIACLNEISRFFKREIPTIGSLVPPKPKNDIIDLDAFERLRLEHAMLATFDPLMVDKQLRLAPDKFEEMRSNYDHPREFKAYYIKHATEKERLFLAPFGFHFLE